MTATVSELWPWRCWASLTIKVVLTTGNCLLPYAGSLLILIRQFRMWWPLASSVNIQRINIVGKLVTQPARQADGIANILSDYALSRGSYISMIWAKLTSAREIVTYHEVNRKYKYDASVMKNKFWFKCHSRKPDFIHFSKIQKKIRSIYFLSSQIFF